MIDAPPNIEDVAAIRGELAAWRERQGRRDLAIVNERPQHSDRERPAQSAFHALREFDRFWRGFATTNGGRVA